MAFIKKQIGWILLIISFTIGLIIYKDYGISWDEPGSHQIGTLNYDYIFSGSRELLTYPEKDYGVAFELPLIFIEKILGLKDSRSIYLERHLLTHLFFLFSAFVCFLLIDYLYQNKLLACIGFLLFVLNPLIYAHSFFNSKDIPFMGMFMICFYISAKAFRSKSMKYFVLLAISTGLLINMRIIGILPAGCTLLFLSLDYFLSQQRKSETKKTIYLLGAFLLTAIITLLISWPYLWTSPLKNFADAIKHMSRFTWYFNVLFNGHSIPANQIPWTYLPVWFCITTPILFLLTGFSGMILFILRLFKNPLSFLKNSTQRNNLMYAICFFAPVLAVIVLHSILYDGWRHLFFIYPSFILLAIYGLDAILKTRAKKIVIALTGITFCVLLFFSINNHPFQHLYFNKLVDTKTPEYLRSQFELEYWGTSYKQSLEYILQHDHSATINIAAENEPGHYNLMILYPEERNRIHITDVSNADYFITNYRWHPQEYTEFKGKEWHSFKVNGNSINTIFKLK